MLQFVISRENAAWDSSNCFARNHTAVSADAMVHRLNHGAFLFGSKVNLFTLQNIVAPIGRKERRIAAEIVVHT